MGYQALFLACNCCRGCYSLVVIDGWWRSLVLFSEMTTESSSRRSDQPPTPALVKDGNVRNPASGGCGGSPSSTFLLPRLLLLLPIPAATTVDRKIGKSFDPETFGKYSTILCVIMGAVTLTLKESGR